MEQYTNRYIPYNSEQNGQVHGYLDLSLGKNKGKVGNAGESRGHSMLESQTDPKLAMVL